MIKNLATRALRNNVKAVANASFCRTMATTREITVREALREAMDEEMGKYHSAHRLINGTSSLTEK